MNAHIDVTIQTLEKLYESITGHEPPRPEPPHAPLAEDGEPLAHVDAGIDALLSMLGTAAPATLRAPVVPTWTPPVTIWAERDLLHLVFELGGIRREQVEVAVEGQSVVISGRRAAPWSDDAAAHAVEVTYGPFSRRVALPAGVEPDGARAAMRDGMLEVTVPIGAAALRQARPVTIE